MALLRDDEIQDRLEQLETGWRREGDAIARQFTFDDFQGSVDFVNRIAWRYLGGDIKDVDGEYIFEDQGDGTTLATYSLALDPGVWLPDRIARVINQQVMRRSVEELRERVEALG